MWKDKKGENYTEDFNIRVINETVLKGWSYDTLPNAPIQEIELLRCDADAYESTMDCLKYLYPKVS